MNTDKNHLTMRSLPADDRPCEKMLAMGERVLTDAELLAVIIRSGNRSETSLALCQRLLTSCGAHEKGIAVLHDMSVEELTANAGIGQVKATQIKAALEIGRRAAYMLSRAESLPIRSPQDAICLLESEMRNLPREELRLVLLDVRNRVIRIRRIAEGGLTTSVVYPRELFREAVKANAAAMILAHNHPSGDASPSRDDLDTTRRIVEAGEMMGIKVFDHIILAAGGSISFRQSGLI